MAPRTTFLLALTGVILVGLPLPLLSEPGTPASNNPAIPEVLRETVWGEMRFSGQPESIRLRTPGADWMSIDATSSPAEFEIELPTTGAVELEVEAQWAEESPQALSITLEPAGQAPCSDTQWSDAGSARIHSIFTFQW